MLEGVFVFGKRGLLVDKLRGLQVREQRRQFIVGLADHAPHQPDRKFLADHRERLQQLLVRAASLSMRAASIPLTVDGIWIDVSGLTIDTTPSRASTPWSNSTCTISSIKNGLPCVRSMIVALT